MRLLPLLVAASVAVACTHVAPAVSRTPPIPFVDAHVHLNDERMQLELMQRHGAERAVIFWGRNSDNDSIAQAAQRHPQRFIPFVSVSPERTAYRRAWSVDDSALLQELDTQLASGRFKGIGEISSTHFPSPGFAETDFDPMGSTLTGIMALARKHRVPVMVHIEITRLQEFARLLKQFGDVPVIWAHGGYTPLYMARRMLEAHPNLYYELSARTWPLHPRSPDYTILRDGERIWPEWLALIESKPERFVVGTDASHRSLESETMKANSVQNFLRQLQPETREQVGRTNLLGLVERKP